MSRENKEPTHWLSSPNKNYLGHFDLPECGYLNVTIKSAQWEAVKNPITNTSESKRVIRFHEALKPMICNQTNAQSIYKIGGVKHMEHSDGVKICLYVASIVDRKSKENIDCIRVKAPVMFTKERLQQLFNKKSSSLPDEFRKRLQDILENEKESSYQGAIQYLEK